MILHQRRGLIAREVDGEALILDRASSKVHQLNATAAFIWDHCDGASTIEDVAEDFAASFGVDAERARQDVERTVGALADLGLLDSVSTGDSGTDRRAA